MTDAAVRPIVVDLECMRGDDFEARWEFVDDATGLPYFWSGLTFAAQLRTGYDDPDVVDFVIDDTQQAFGVVVQSLAADTVAGLGGVYVYDMQYTDPASKTHTIIKGSFFVSLDVTRAVGS